MWLNRSKRNSLWMAFLFSLDVGHEFSRQNSVVCNQTSDY
jgi:hypothetical protein